MCSEPGFGASVSVSRNDDRRRLAVKAQALGREALAQIASVATPATLLRWYRCLIAVKYDGSKNSIACHPSRIFRRRAKKTSCTGSPTLSGAQDARERCAHQRCR